MAYSPMLAKIGKKGKPPSKGWIFERKFDGERCIAVKSGKKVRLLSRNNKSLNRNYPEIAAALAKQRRDFVIDGEVCAFKKGVSNFEKLQPRMHVKTLSRAAEKIKVYYYIFDILEANGKKVMKLPLVQRKKVLKKTVSFSGIIRYTEHRDDGKAYYKKACKLGWEGVIGKDKKSTYKHSRSADWLKFKCENNEEFYVGGFTNPQGSRKGFGALLLGNKKGGKMQYIGKVGTGKGFTAEFLKRFANRLKNLETKKSPFARNVKERGAHWVHPRIMVQIAFTEWTKDGKLRHPHFLGIRWDKSK